MSKKNELKTCSKCAKSKVAFREFYATSSPLFADGRVPLCKSCFKKELNENDIGSVKRILRQMDKPFIVEEWNRAVASDRETLGTYLRTISSLAQYKDLTYEDSAGQEEDVIDRNHEAPKLNLSDDIYGVPSIDIIRKWGEGYTNREYYELEKTWDEMITANEITTPQHKSQLKLYCTLALKVYAALDTNDISAFEKLNKQFLDVQKNAGFRPIDRKSGDESAGIRNFSVIFEEVERDGFIKPPPLDVPQDIVDATILYMQNYTRKLLDMEKLAKAPDDTPKVGDFE
ncbi:hypothetical protein M5X17_27395 [Paenibacillus alvei]|uniref:hypothetical protein n=1 Tax=Paenibacillus alvei TaxID=44250 RepID=UPI00228300C0|nr:hypothetical protein [Paenibacillus alvei]MCY9737430.1 hypothetical protein [Paenibacillus alvei]